MKKKANLILAIISALVYVSVIIMKFFTQIDIPTSSFMIITLLFIISESQFAAGCKSSK